MVNFKILVGVLVVFVSLVVVGCYMPPKSNCVATAATGAGNFQCYGSFMLLKDIDANAQFCDNEHYVKVGGVCLLKKTATQTCNQLLDSWETSVTNFGYNGYIPQMGHFTYGLTDFYHADVDAHLCTVYCKRNSDCASESCYTWRGSGGGICVPSCRTDADCIGGVSTCERIKGKRMCVPTSKPATISYDGLILNYEFEDGAVDGSIMGNDGNVQNAVIADGVATFDGSGDYIGAGRDHNLDVRNTMTAMAWVKGSPQQGKGIVVRWDYGNNQRAWAIESGRQRSKRDNARILISDDGRWGDSANQRGLYYDSHGTILDDTWHHIAFTFNKGDLKLYVDGVLDDHTVYRDSAVANTMHQSTSPVLVGAIMNGGTPSNFFTGQIDGVRVYDYAMSEQEINNIKGNPPAVAVVADEDGDGVPDADDACPGTREPTTKSIGADGCLEQDVSSMVAGQKDDCVNLYDVWSIVRGGILSYYQADNEDGQALRATVTTNMDLFCEGG